MQRRFLLNLILLLFVNLLVKPFWVLGIDRSVNVLVGPEVYGEYFALFNFSLLFNIFLDMGITNFNNRNIAQHQHLLQKYFQGIVSLKLFLCVGYTLFTLGIAVMLGYSHYRLEMLSFLVVNQILVSFNLYLRSNISGLQMFATDSIISVLDRVLMIGMASALIWGGISDEPFNIMWFVYIQTIGYAVATLVSLIIVVVKSGGFALKFKKTFTLALLKQTFPYALLVLTMTFYYRVDAVMLDQMLPNGEEQAGIYAQAYRLLDAANMFGVLFAQLLLPMFAYMIKRKEPIGSLLKFSYSLLVVPAALMAIVCIFYSDELMHLMYEDHALSSAPILKVLMGCFLAIASTYVFGTLLTANGSMRVLNTVAIIGLFLNVVLNFVLIPKYEALGSAYASLATQLLVILVQVLVVQRVFTLKPDGRFLLRLFAFMVLAGSLTTGAYYADFAWYWEAIGIFALGIILAFAIRLIRLKELLELMKRQNAVT